MYILLFKISNLNIIEQLIFSLLKRAQQIDVGKGDIKAPVSLCHLTLIIMNINKI